MRLVYQVGKEYGWSVLGSIPRNATDIGEKQGVPLKGVGKFINEFMQKELL